MDTELDAIVESGNRYLGISEEGFFQWLYDHVGIRVGYRAICSADDWIKVRDFFRENWFEEYVRETREKK